MRNAEKGYKLPHKAVTAVAALSLAASGVAAGRTPAGAAELNTSPEVAASHSREIIQALDGKWSSLAGRVESFVGSQASKKDGMTVRTITYKTETTPPLPGDILEVVSDVYNAKTKATQEYTIDISNPNLNYHGSGVQPGSAFQIQLSEGHAAQKPTTQAFAKSLEGSTYSFNFAKQDSGQWDIEASYGQNTLVYTTGPIEAHPNTPKPQAMSDHMVFVGKLISQAEQVLSAAENQTQVGASFPQEV